MPQDAFTLSHLAGELNALLCEAKVNKIVQPTADTVVFSLYGGRGKTALEISCNPAFSRICLTSSHLPAPAVCPNFCMLLRKHLLGAQITGVKTVDFERVVQISFLHKNELLVSGEKILYAELMGKYSNLFLAADGVILGSAKTATLEECAQRPVLVGMPYRLPPPQDKASPLDKAQLAARIAAFSGGNLADFLFRNVKGICRDTAVQACLSILGSEETNAMSPAESKAFAASLCYFLTEKPARPCVILQNGTACDYSAYYPLCGKEYEKYDSLLSACADFVRAKLSDEKLREKRHKLLGTVSGAEKKLSRKLSFVLEDLKSAENAEQNRIFGELITTNIYRLKKGDESAVLFDYYQGKDCTVPLDKTKSPAANAQAYYKKYNKQKRTTELLSPVARSLENEIEYLATVKAEIELAETYEDLAAAKEELLREGILHEEKSALKGKKQPSVLSRERVYAVNGYVVRAGRNNVQNDRITVRAKPEHLWLHTKNYHGCHVVIEGNGKYPDDVVQIAAEIAAYYSKGRNGDKIPVDYCLKKYVKKPPAAKAGQVFYTDFRTAYVTPNAHEELLEKE